MLKKIYPFDSESSFDNSFKIIFISEGYLAAESFPFISSCIHFIDKLLETSPFNLTRINSNWLSIYASFTPSANSGSSINVVPAAWRTAFKSQVNTSTGLISINQSKLNAYLDAEGFNDNGTEILLKELLKKGQLNYGPTGSLVVIILPPKTKLHLLAALSICWRARN